MPSFKSAFFKWRDKFHNLGPSRRGAFLRFVHWYSSRWHFSQDVETVCHDVHVSYSSCWHFSQNVETVCDSLDYIRHQVCPIASS